MKKIIGFVRSHYLLIFLILYGFILVVFKAGNGSFQCDEAIYSQVARESMARNSFLSLYWGGLPWFEKPPLTIWLTMFSFKIFGISEFSSRIFSGIFGVLVAVLVYFFGKNLFKSKLAGFFSGFVLLTTPMFVWSIRSNMMDTALCFFVSLGALALWKSTEGSNKWLILFWAATGLSIMTKSIIGLPPLIILFLYLLIKKRNICILTDKYNLIGLLIFFIISIPWHIYMSLNFGKLFWKEYLAYQVFNRFYSPILHTAWDDSLFSYVVIYFQRSGVWPIVLIALSLISYKIIFEARNRFLFLGTWAFSLFLVISLSKTKLPHYFLPIYIPLVLATGGLLSFHLRKKSRLVGVISAILLLNILPFYISLASDYGESHLLVGKLLVSISHFSNFQLIYLFLVIIVILIYLALNIEKRLLTALNIFLMIPMPFLLPFAPQRNAEIKSEAISLSRFNSNNPLNLYVKDSGAKPVKALFLFYLPLGSKVEKYYKRDFNFSDSSQKNSFCFLEKDLDEDELNNSVLFSNQEGVILACKRISHESPPHAPILRMVRDKLSRENIHKDNFSPY